MDVGAQKTRSDGIRSLLSSLEAHAPGEEAHAQRVAVYAVATAHRMGIRDGDLLTVKEAALLHDLGKLLVDRAILSSNIPLSEEGLNLLRQHSMLAIHALNSNLFESCIPIIRHHHERWDGAGYPSGLAGVAIPIGARVLAVAETFDVIANYVGWRKPMEEETALAEMRKASGSQFDPEVVEAFLQVQPLIQPVS